MNVPPSESSPGRGISSRAAEWRKRLAIAASAYPLFETGSGLAITFVPFSAATHWTVIVHIAAQPQPKAEASRLCAFEGLLRSRPAVASKEILLHILQTELSSTPGSGFCSCVLLYQLRQLLPSN
ncbi:MAG: hypothetical protein U0166_09605 [Acidobacteriota bacterium]